MCSRPGRLMRSLPPQSASAGSLLPAASRVVLIHLQHWSGVYVVHICLQRRVQSIKITSGGEVIIKEKLFFPPTLQKREKNSFTPFNQLRPQISALPSHYYCNATWVLIKRSAIGFCFRLRSSSSRVSREIPADILIIPSWHFPRLFEKLSSTLLTSSQCAAIETTKKKMYSVDREARGLHLLQAGERNTRRVPKCFICVISRGQSISHWIYAKQFTMVTSSDMIYNTVYLHRDEWVHYLHLFNHLDYLHPNLCWNRRKLNWRQVGRTRSWSGGVTFIVCKKTIDRTASELSSRSVFFNPKSWTTIHGPRLSINFIPSPGVDTFYADDTWLSRVLAQPYTC